MGEVYEVEHADLGRRFAVKLLHTAHRGRADLAARMRDEARSIGRLRHRNLVEVLDLGVTADDRPYFTMELLQGRDLRAELERLGVIAVPTALALAAQALDGLGEAHAAGIVHRDIKLENLFLCDDGALKVLDFGVARGPRGSAWRTAAGAVVGTPRTMAPEQHASGPMDQRADLYSVGLALYEMVAGRGPFDELRGQANALRFAHCERCPPPPSRFAPQPIPPEVEHLILRALEKSPERRFPSAAEMASEIHRILPRCESTRCTRPSGATPNRRARPSRPLRRLRPARSPQAWIGAVGLCALAVASAAFGVALGQRLPASSAAAPPVHVEARSTPSVR
jgi:serine/threonine protein kinase